MEIKRAPQENLGERQRFIKLVHKGTNKEKGKVREAPGEKLGQSFKGEKGEEESQKTEREACVSLLTDNTFSH